MLQLIIKISFFDKINDVVIVDTFRSFSDETVNYLIIY